MKGTSDHGLFLPADNLATYHTFIDADWRRDLDTRKSTSSILHKIGDSCIFWSSKLQPTVSLSSTKAEYRVLTHATKDIIYFRRLLTELGIIISEPTLLLTDNKSSIKLAHNPVMHTWTKHIEIQNHFIREALQDKIVSVAHVPTQNQQADFLTKPLQYSKFIENKHNACIISSSVTRT